LQAVFGEDKVHLLVPAHESYLHLRQNLYIVLASGRELKREEFAKLVPGRTSVLMPPAHLRQYLLPRSGLVISDDYAPIDNMLAPFFEERFGYKRH
jgi:hypothetical protein